MDAAQSLRVFILALAKQVGLNARRHAKPADTWKFQRRSANIKPEHGTQEIYLEAFNPADREAEIASERCVNAGARRRQSEPVAFIRVIFADRRRRKNRLQFWNGIQHRLAEGIRIRPRPWAIVAVGAKLIILDHMTDLGDEAARLLTVDCDKRFRNCAEPACVRGKSVVSDRLTPGGVIVSAIGRRTLFLEDDPAMNSEDTAPSYGACSINSDQRVGMARRRRQKPGA